MSANTKVAAEGSFAASTDMRSATAWSRLVRFGAEAIATVHERRLPISRAARGVRDDCSSGRDAGLNVRLDT